MLYYIPVRYLIDICSTGYVTFKVLPCRGSKPSADSELGNARNNVASNFRLHCLQISKTKQTKKKIIIIINATGHVLHTLGKLLRGICDYIL